MYFSSAEKNSMIFISQINYTKQAGFTIYYDCNIKLSLTLLPLGSCSI